MKDLAMTGLSDMTDTISRKVDETTDTVQRALHEAVDSLESTAGQLKAMEKQVSASCGNYVRQNPATSVGAALAAGFLLGWLARSR